MSTTALPETSPVDFDVEDHGSIFLVRPLNETFRQDIEENVGSEAQWFGGALVVEHRYIADFIETAAGRGFYCNLNA